MKSLWTELTVLSMEFKTDCILAQVKNPIINYEALNRLLQDTKVVAPAIIRRRAINQ